MINIVISVNFEHLLINRFDIVGHFYIVLLLRKNQLELIRNI